MKKFNPITSMAVMAILTFDASMPLLSYAGTDHSEAPVPVSSYINDNSPTVENLSDPTVNDIAAYLQEKYSSESDDAEYVRIRNFDPASAAGKVVIKVHKSTDSSIPEFLEVFRQNSADPSDLEAINLFDNGTSNRALVSTAGTYDGKQYVTPTGDFAFDSFELMHHSKTYNDAPMPYSMFFNGGIAIHGATPSEFHSLGKVASHGCVRVHPDNAKLLFNYITPAGRGNAVVEVLDN